VTICIAWKDATNVYMLADSVVTWNDGRVGMPRSDSTFIEPATNPRRGIINETGYKVFRLGPTTIATMTGQIGPALNALRNIRNSLRYGRSLRESIALGDEFLRHEFRLLIGGRQGSSLPELYEVVSDGSAREIYEENTPIVLGGVSAERKESAKNIVLWTYENGAASDPDVALVGALTAMQAFGRRTNLLDENAGGAFFGRRTDGTRVYPQPDILYCVFPLVENLRKNESHEFAHVGIRDGALVAFPGTLPAAVMVSDVEDLTEREIAAAVGPRKKWFSRTVPFLALIEKQRGALVVIDRRLATHAPSLTEVARRDGSTKLVLDNAILRLFDSSAVDSNIFPILVKEEPLPHVNAPVFTNADEPMSPRLTKSQRSRKKARKGRRDSKKKNRGK